MLFLHQIIPYVTLTGSLLCKNALFKTELENVSTARSEIDIYLKLKSIRISCSL